MEELQVIETTSGRQFKPWATKDDVQDPASVTAITSEIASGKQAIAEAINAKGGEASATESFNELAGDVINLNKSFITYGVEVTEKIHWLRFICESSTVARLPLTAINDDSIVRLSQPSAFQNCTALESVKMSALTTISGSYVFNSCSSLQEVNLPNLTTISGGYVFNSCSSLQEVNMPNLATISGGYVFASCSALQEVNLPNLATISGGDVFNRCSSLQEVNLPNLATISGGDVFYICIALQEVIMPNLATISGIGVFNRCSALQSVEFGTLTTIADPFDTAKPNLRNITIGQDTNINLPFQQWTATNVIAEGQSGIDELNSNLQTNLISKLYQGGGKILRLGAALYDVTTQETRDMVTAKGWALQRG